MLARCVSRVSVLVVLMVATGGIGVAQNNWIGPNGTVGNWSDPLNWSAGVPISTDDVIIYSGGYDYVYLDPGSATINSLTLGGADNGTSWSFLTDNGIAQNLSINQGLTVGQTGFLYLTGGSTVTANWDSLNAGGIYISNGSSLTVSGKLKNEIGAELVPSKARAIPQTSVAAWTTTGTSSPTAEATP